MRSVIQYSPHIVIGMAPAYTLWNSAMWTYIHDHTCMHVQCTISCAIVQISCVSYMYM